ncbi:hypothetical protein BC008_23065 [Mastigocoleus testarum BC008]|uniref:Uncharacterized protein n=1 Tax=Mastigocoleus testarum BC008 TaxID=371196 RepID=A0A0V7ZNP6_9CYAN|nr:hypothetical protein BC008_23065 [Mastigocoleus testarum BC008]
MREKKLIHAGTYTVYAIKKMIRLISLLGIVIFILSKFFFKNLDKCSLKEGLRSKKSRIARNSLVKVSNRWE